MSEDYVKLYKYIPIDDSKLRLSRFESIINRDVYCKYKTKKK